MARRATTRPSDGARASRLRAVPPRERAVEAGATSTPPSEGEPRLARRARLWFATLAAWLAAIGVGLLLFVLPAAGLVCLVAAAVAGALAALTPRHEIEPEQTAEPPET